MSATCLINVITCRINGTSLLAVTSPCKNHAGWPFWCPYRNVDFQPITLHRATNSAKSRNKIRLAFHFVERNRSSITPKRAQFRKWALWCTFVHTSESGFEYFCDCGPIFYNKLQSANDQTFGLVHTTVKVSVELMRS